MKIIASLAVFVGALAATAAAVLSPGATKPVQVPQAPQQAVTQGVVVPCPCTPAPNRATAVVSSSNGSINIGLCGVFDSTGFCDSYEGAGFGGGNWMASLIYQGPCFSPPATPDQAHGPRWWLQVWLVGGPGYWESWTPTGPKAPPNFTDGTWTVTP